MATFFHTGPAAVMAALFLYSVTPYAAIDSTSGKSGFQFLEEPTTPNLIAMGNAGTAMPGSGFAYYNPAQPSFSNAPSLSIGFAPLPGDLTAMFGQGTWTFSNWFIGMRLSNFAIDNIYRADERGPNYTDPFTSGFSLVSMDAGYSYGRGSLALTLNGGQDRIETSTAYCVSVSAGGLYRLIPGKLSIGAALFHLGTSTGYTDATQNWGEGDPLPRSGRFGVAYGDTLKHIPFNAACDVVYRDVGDKLSAVKGVLPRITVPVGVEVWPNEYIAIRAGKRINFETEVINFGAGVKFNPLIFDMSFVITKLDKDIEVQPMFQLTYTVTSRSEHTESAVIRAPTLEIKSADTIPSQKINSPAEPRDSALAAPDSTAHSISPLRDFSDSTVQPDTLQPGNSPPDKELPQTPPLDMNKKTQPVDVKDTNTAPGKP
jgi:hypothetical protein